MPIIYSSSSGTKDDGVIYKSNQSSWVNARDATSGTASLNSSLSSYFTGVIRGPSRSGGIVYTVYRSFMVFDTSSITGTIASAELSIYGFSSNDGSVIAVKSNAYGGDGGTALANGDFAVWNSTGTGYGNTTSAVNAVQFTMSSGTIDSGRIALYGIK